MKLTLEEIGKFKKSRLLEKRGGMQVPHHKCIFHMAVAVQPAHETHALPLGWARSGEGPGGPSWRRARGRPRYADVSRVASRYRFTAGTGAHSSSVNSRTTGRGNKKALIYGSEEEKHHLKHFVKYPPYGCGGQGCPFFFFNKRMQERYLQADFV